MTDELFTLNVNKDGSDVIHKYPSLEQCNQDDAIDTTRVDALTAEGLIRHTNVRRCGHCWPEDAA